jgi:hypothetical protein
MIVLYFLLLVGLVLALELVIGSETQNGTPTPSWIRYVPLCKVFGIIYLLGRVTSSFKTLIFLLNF